MDAVTNVPAPGNEPVLTYAPGSPERAALQQRLTELAAEPLELTMTIGDKQRMGSGERFDVVQPHRHAAVLRSEEHTSELQSRQYLVCRLLLEKKKKYYHNSLFLLSNSPLLLQPFSLFLSYTYTVVSSILFPIVFFFSCFSPP